MKVVFICIIIGFVPLVSIVVGREFGSDIGFAIGFGSLSGFLVYGAIRAITYNGY